MRKPAFCICENKDADQLRGNREADQRLCFRYTDSTIPLLSKSVISSLKPSSVAVQPGLCRTWSETPKTGFLRTAQIDLGTGMKMDQFETTVIDEKTIKKDESWPNNAMLDTTIVQDSHFVKNKVKENLAVDINVRFMSYKTNPCDFTDKA